VQSVEAGCALQIDPTKAGWPQNHACLTVFIKCKHSDRLGRWPVHLALNVLLSICVLDVLDGKFCRSKWIGKSRGTTLFLPRACFI
jgi:hypothetical protein